MRILADENMPGVDRLFASVATDIVYTAGRTLSAAQVAHADVLLVRSVTPVNADLLADHSPRFIGSATIGTDHIDIPFLASRQIPFAHAPGCNADAVCDYVLAALLALHAQTPAELQHKTLSVIGAGNVGRRVVQRFRALGLSVKVCDPPRAEREPDGETFVSLYDALQADIVCVHTPLTTIGNHPTHQLLDAAALALLPDNSILLNAGRGAVIEEEALLRFLAQRPDVRVVLDVWGTEPAIERSLLPLVEIATGHVAGYSLEGKWRGTRMLRAALDRQLARQGDPLPELSELLPVAPSVVVLESDPWQALYDTVEAVYDIRGDDRRFRGAMAQPNHAEAFDAYRKAYPVRREIGSCRALVGDSPARALLAAAGFIVD
ncbi:4-phosphoerythronate dehydrogenase [Salinispirillum sp. LH 10-3-1]|uniref:Erythronate-4-phosphate dehydrogenase n=1 Tax=Salinispirillum sp. LH 10-3-1 TaxID=2952525 RepID=A0AB38YD99_9GAMM